VRPQSPAFHTNHCNKNSVCRQRLTLDAMKR
jgi:hypothetical protein